MYRILALGDSVIWGLGLRDKHKFVNKVAAEIESRRSVDQTELVSLAHAGAIIGNGRSTKYEKIAEEDPAPRYDEELHYLYGEIGQHYPSVFTQLRISEARNDFMTYLRAVHDFNVDEHEDHKRRARNILGEGWTPDLIIMDGGINDMDPFSIMFPFNLSEFDELDDDRNMDRFLDRFDFLSTENNLKEIMQSAFEDRLSRLLARTAEAFPNAKIVVTGYFPVMTQNSFSGLRSATWALIVYNYLQMLSPSWSVSARVASILVSFITLLGRKKLIDRWALFDREHARLMQSAIDQVDSNNIFFAKPEWGPDNGIYAPENWLFEWELRDGTQIISAKDPKEQARKDAFDQYADNRDGMTRAIRAAREGRTARASFAHPNASGAHAYVEAIMDVIDRNNLIR